jgi:type II secretion system protein N
MKPPGSCVRWCGVVLAFPVLFVLAVYIFFPVQRIESEIIRMLESQRLNISRGLHKTVLPGLEWEKPVLTSEQGPLFSAGRLRIQPHWRALLGGRPVLNATASIGGGRIEADYGFTGKQPLAVNITGINLGDVPFFKTVMAARATGNLWSEGHFARDARGLSGELRLEVKQLNLSGVRLGAFPLPDVTDLLSRGMVRVTENRARLESFTLEGEGVFMRLSGDVPVSDAIVVAPLNMVLEIMPKPEFLEKQKLVFLMLAKFMVSPGVYRVPIRGTLLKPEIL